MTNYIRHLNKAFEKICEDQRLTPFHISLYFSLFQYWNMARFRSPISISRDELMRAAKIGSVNTYIRCIKQLDQWQYIKYQPSYNPQKGSLVYMYTFNTSADNGNGNANNNATNNPTEMPVIPSINNTNKPNKKNNSNPSEHTTIFNNENKRVGVGNNSTFKKEKEKSSAKKEKSPPLKGVAEGRGMIPSLAQIKNHFAENKFPELEADKFFNHYESNGWMVGGKSPMKNWKAASRNWILNSQKFNNTKKQNTHVTTSKNYKEPL